MAESFTLEDLKKDGVTFTLSDLKADTTPASVSAGRALLGIPRQLGLTARYGMEGLANAAQIFTEPVAVLMRAAGLNAAPLGEVATRAADALGLPSPATANERVIGDAARLVAGAGGTAGAANLISRGVGGTAQAVAQQLAANPIQQASAAAGGGLAGGSVREAGGDAPAQVGAAVVGTVLGGLAPGAASSAANRVQALVRRPDPLQLEGRISLALRESGVDWQAVPQAIKSQLVQDVRKATATGAELNNDALRRLADFRLTGTTPTRGMLTLDPVQITREQNLAKIGANTADAELQGLARVQNQNNATLIRNVNQLGADRGDLMTAGQRSVGMIQGQDASMGQRVSDLYRQARNMPGGDVPLNTADLLNNINTQLARSGKAAFLPDEINRVIEQLRTGSARIGGQEVPVNFDAQSLDSLMTAIATAQRGSRDGNVRMALSAVRQAINDTPILPVKTQFGGNQLVTEQGAQFLRNQDAQAGNFMGALNEARQAAAQRFGWRESSRPIESAVNGAEPDKFIQQFVINGNVADARSLAMSGDRPAIKDALANWLKEKALNGATDETGKFSQSAFNKAVKQLGQDKLRLFFSPEEMQAIQANARVSSYMQAQPVGSAVNNSNSGALMLGQGYDWLNAVASKVPFGKSVIVDPLRSIDVSLSQRQAQNIMPALVNQQSRPLLPGLVGPGVAMGGLLAAPGVDRP